MRVIITSGGLKEPIDSVRSITNTSTGQLGALIAEEFARADSGADITYIHAVDAIVPNSARIDLISAKTANSTKEVISNLLSHDHYDVFIHAMAVSDFSTRAVLPLEEILEKFNQSVEDLPTPDFNRKISSVTKNPVIVLEQTPKIIDSIKELAPEITLVGFKLVSSVTPEQMEQTAREIQARTNADYIVANRLEDISSDNHIAYLVSNGDTQKLGNTKREIAANLVKTLYPRL